MTSVKVTPDAPVAGAIVPAFTTKIHYIKKRISVSIQLHNIPDKHINLEISSTHFHLDTLAFSKKYYLHFRFPTKIKVDENGIDVDFSSGTLRVEMKITQILDENTGKLMAFKGKTKSTAAPSKASRKPPTPSESEESSEEYEQSGESGEESDDGAYMDVSESESSEEPEVPAKGKKQSKTVASKEAALKILEEVNQKEEMRRKQKLAAENAKEEFFTKKAEEREKVKESKRALKEATMKKLFAAHEAERAEKKAMKEPSKRSKRQVQFEDEEAVQPVAKRAKK
jgi:DNA polymerase III gamma/tau subunit